MRAIRKPDGAGRAGDFLHRHDMGEIAEPDAAIFLIDRDPEKTELTHLFPEFHRKLIRPVDLRRHRRNAVLRPAVGHLAQGLNLVSKGEIHRCREHQASP